jgi:SAM-dependent methyltransferase
VRAAQLALVADVGAGTGILTRALVAMGCTVVPVEPDPGMRARLEAVTPGVSVLAGTAESVPLADASVDAVVAGQAYHWFDPEPAHAEIARVLRGGGTFGVLWNLRDESVSWVAALSAIIEQARESSSPPETDRRPESFGPRFGPVERAEFAHTTQHTVDSLLAMLQTRSYFLVASARRRRDFEEAVRDLLRTHPDVAGRDTFELPYRTVAYRARRR